MTWTVHTCLITLAILCVWQADLAETCSCSRKHPQEQFCSADMVMKATIDGKLRVGITMHGNFSAFGYVHRLKTFKGTCAKIDQILTASSSARCGVRLDRNKEYLLSGSVQGNRLNVYHCDLVKQWDKLTDSEREDVVYKYELGCGCKFTYCSTEPCATSGSAGCLWGSEATEIKLFGKSTKGYTCTMKKDKSCAWCKNGELNCIDLKEV